MPFYMLSVCITLTLNFMVEKDIVIRVVLIILK